MREMWRAGVSDSNSHCQSRSHCHEPEATDPGTHARGMESEAVAVFGGLIIQPSLGTLGGATVVGLATWVFGTVLFLG